MFLQIIRAYFTNKLFLVYDLGGDGGRNSGDIFVLEFACGGVGIDIDAVVFEWYYGWRRSGGKVVMFELSRNERGSEW